MLDDVFPRRLRAASLRARIDRERRDGGFNNSFYRRRPRHPVDQPRDDARRSRRSRAASSRREAAPLRLPPRKLENARSVVLDATDVAEADVAAWLAQLLWSRRTRRERSRTAGRRLRFLLEPVQKQSAQIRVHRGRCRRHRSYRSHTSSAPGGLNLRGVSPGRSRGILRIPHEVTDVDDADPEEPDRASEDTKRGEGSHAMWHDADGRSFPLPGSAEISSGVARTARRVVWMTPSEFAQARREGTL